jgi:hypothetical protein
MILYLGVLFRARMINRGQYTYALVSLPVREDFPDTLVLELSLAVSTSF